MHVLTPARSRLDREHVAAVAAWAIPAHGTLAALPTITGGVTLRISGCRARARAYRALDTAGYAPLRLSNRHGTVTAHDWTPPTARIVAETEDDRLIVECPLCVGHFPAPAVVAGALIDCPGCPWRGTAGTAPLPAAPLALIG